MYYLYKETSYGSLVSDVSQYHIHWLEFNWQQAREHSRQIGKHIKNLAIIYHLSGLMLVARQIAHILQQTFYIDNDYYPERLGQIINLVKC